MKVDMHEPQGTDCRTNGMPPISRVLRDVLNRAEGDAITLATIVDSLGERTMAILMILFCLPNCLPVPPGVGLVFGFPMLLVAAQMILAYQRPWLPRKLLVRSIKTDAYAKMIDLAEPRLQRIESYLKPRYTFLFSGIAERLLGVFFALCAISVILPLPGSNFPPAIASVLVSLAMLEEDGIVLLVGLTLGILGLTYTTVVGGALIWAAIYAMQTLLGL